MLNRFRSKFGKAFAKGVNLAALLSLLASLFTAAPLPVQAAEALGHLSTTLAQPIYSNDYVTDPTYTNVSYTWEQTKAYDVAGGDACITAQDCMDIIVDLQDTAPTTSFLGQEWQSSIVPGDVVWSGMPANSSVSSTQRIDNDSNGRFERLKIVVQCSAACVFATSTAYTISIVNYPLKNPQTPGGYTAGSYTSLTQAMTIQDNSVSNQQDESETSIVAIGKGLTVTASVDPTLTFSVSGVASSTAFYGDNSTVSTVSNPDACSFGTLTPGAPKVCLFNLNIDTNASNGYAIYVVQDQDMTFNGNTIKAFKDGARVDDATSTYWTSPLLASYGHLGYSSNDTSVFVATSTALWAGIPNIATSAQAPVITGLVADSAAPGTDTYVYALKVESTSALPQGTAYTHHEYFLVVGNF